MQLNEAYTEPTVWHTAIGTPEQEVQLNQAYGVRGEGCVGVDAEETGDEYERMYAAAVNRHEMLRPNAMELGKCSNIAKPGEYETPVQQQENVYTELK